MAICVIAVVSVAPCQCFSLGANQTTSPGRISSVGPSQHCAQPRPDVTINVCPSGCVCQAVRAHGSNVTLAQRMRAGSGGSNSDSIHTFPVNHSVGPSCPAGLSRDSAGTAEAVAEEEADACVSTRLISMLSMYSLARHASPATPVNFLLLNCYFLLCLQRPAKFRNIS